jgi:hypothetical protein
MDDYVRDFKLDNELGRCLFGWIVTAFLTPALFLQEFQLECLIFGSRRSSGKDTLRTFIYSGYASFAATVTNSWNLEYELSISISGPV